MKLCIRPKRVTESIIDTVLIWIIDKTEAFIVMIENVAVVIVLQKRNYVTLFTDECKRVLVFYHEGKTGNFESFRKTLEAFFDWIGHV